MSAPPVDPLSLELAVHRAVASVDDPEYPGISIVDLGLLERIVVGGDGGDGAVIVELVPTFTGCPALAVIADDVREAVETVDGIGSVEVRWLTAPAWTTDRITAAGRRSLSDRFTVAVEIGGSSRPSATCPRCGSPTVEQSMFGPSRCRSVHRCQGCGETIEVMRG